MNFERESFFYEAGELCTLVKGEKKLLKNILKDEDVPTYIYRLETIKKRIEAYKTGLKSLDSQIHYAVKANSNLKLLESIFSQGVGADVVSLGEFKVCLEAGLSASKVIFSGVGKTVKELTEAISLGVFQINCESLPELIRISKIAKSLDKKASVGIRINPNIKASTHPYIATGFKENKFGIPLSDLYSVSKIVSESEGFLELKGLSCHIGSQIMDTGPMAKSSQSLISVYNELIALGHKIESLDLGGGLGVNYQSDDEQDDLRRISEFCAKVSDILKDFPGKVLIEPGRSLVARSGVLLSKIEYVKSNGFKDFIVLNTGTHHLLRPALYKAFHKIMPLKQKKGASKSYDVVGPICESSDVLGFERSFTSPEEGDFLCIFDAGAYGMSMASRYNLHELPNEILL